MSHVAPVVLLGLDAFDLTLVERWTAAGHLPGLAALMQRGHFGVLATPASQYAGGVWPSVYAGVDVATHGVYHNKQWRPGAMRVEVPTDEWIGSRPFWEVASEQQRRVCIVDVPMVLGKPKPLHGIHLSGWGTHDLIASGSWPESLWQQIARAHGPPRMPRERWGRQDKVALLELREAMLRTTEQQIAIALDLMQREHWDLSCLVFGAAHRAGHYLWDLTQLPAGDAADAQRATLESALRDVYQAVDDAVTRVLERVDASAHVCVFAAHGMGPNAGWSDVFATLLEPLQADASGRPARRGALYSVRRHLPIEWVRPILTRLPASATAALVRAWSTRMFDWSTTRVFPVPMDHAGYVRINLRGREREGIVDSGQEYEALCDRLSRAFEGLRDADTGQPIVSCVHRAWRDAAGSARHRDLLPDLVVEWADPRCGTTRRVACDALPGRVFDVPRLLPSGRAGNHRGQAWFIAAGPQVPTASRSTDGDIRDLAPTVASWLDIDPDPSWQGRPLMLPAMD